MQARESRRSRLCPAKIYPTIKPSDDGASCYEYSLFILHPSSFKEGLTNPRQQGIGGVGLEQKVS